MFSLSSFKAFVNNTNTNTNLLKYKTRYKEYTKVHTLTLTSLYINQKDFSGKKHHLITDLYF